MLILYRSATCSFCDEVEEQLKELVLAHRIVRADTAAGALLPDAPLPVLKEGRNLHSGEAAIKAFMKDLRQEVVLGRQFQSDACYLNPDRPGECL